MKCYSLFPGGRHKALTLSYDDGVSSDIRMMEIMRRHGVKGTFNVNAGRMDGEGSPYRLRPEEYGAYEGFELAIHGYSHPFLNRMPADLVIDEIVEDRRAVEKLAGYPVHGMAYPYGAYDDALIELAKKPDTIGFLLPAMEKSQLFRGVIADGVLPRKTFSMGHSREKRYYLEGRKIK